MIVLHNGDAIDGWHHGTTQVLTTQPAEQADLHVYLMRKFLRAAGFDPARGDKLIYIKGTEVHTGETEEKIALTLGAEYLQAHDFVDLSVNGRRIWFTHQGPNSGSGHMAGDALRNWLKYLYWQRVNDRQYVPDLVVTGHYHKATYNSYVQTRNDEIIAIHGLILPSWQMKTRYTYSKVPTVTNKIGAVFMEITAAGGIVAPTMRLLPTENGVSVAV